MRLPAFIALIVAVVLVPTTLGVAKLDHDRDASELDRSLVAETDEHGGALENYFARSRAIILLTANSPAFANVLAEPGTRAQKLRRGGRNLAEVAHHLRYLEQLYPDAIGEACFIDASGREFARAVRGRTAATADLSTTEKQTVFFAPTFALRFGQVHQTAPYVSPDTKEWVVANATLIPQRDGRKRAFVHFEVTVESLRRAMGDNGKGSNVELRVVDGKTGSVVIDGERPQRIHAPLGVPGDARFDGLAHTAGRRGVTTVDGQRVAYRRVGSGMGNANDWLVVASAKTPVGSLLGSLGPLPIAVLVGALAVIAIAGLALRASRRALELQAATDELTGLGNRRRLLIDLERRLKATDRSVVVLFDLNGFKNYNDTFGHAAGDALLVRLGHGLAEAVGPFRGSAYRLGGDEFCVIAPAEQARALEQAACRALSARGEGFSVSTAFGSVVVPDQAADVSAALRTADTAMYAQKQSGRPYAAAA